MPKISGLALGEIKKISGLGIGAIKKVSGLGLGLIWQDAVQVGMFKNGLFDVTTTQQDVPSWTAQDVNSTVSGNALVIPSAGNWTLATSIIHDGTGFTTAGWLQLWIFRNGSQVVAGPQQSVSRPSTGNVYSLSSGSPVACAQGDTITVQCDANAINAVDIIGGTSSWVRATPT